MKRNRILILALLSLTLSVVVTIAAYRFLSSRLAPPTEVVEIAVASHRVPVGSRLTAADVRVVRWPKSVLMEGSIANSRDVVGRGVIVSMLANEPILESKLAPKEGGAGLAAIIPDGMRAMAVKVNDVIGVAGFVLPGTRVDVILSGSPDKGSETDTTKIILENVQVLASGQNVEQDANGRPQNVQVITLLVTPEQAQKLALASVDGRIQLALRNSLDVASVDPPPILRKALYQHSSNALPGLEPIPARRAVKAPALAAAAPPPPIAVVEKPSPPRVLVVELYQGAERKSVTFELKPVETKPPDPISNSSSRATGDWKLKALVP